MGVGLILTNISRGLNLLRIAMATTCYERAGIADIGWPRTVIPYKECTGSRCKDALCRHKMSPSLVLDSAIPCQNDGIRIASAIIHSTDSLLVSIRPTPNRIRLKEQDQLNTSL
jgi:hypothetical protein